MKKILLSVALVIVILFSISCARNVISSDNSNSPTHTEQGNDPGSGSQGDNPGSGSQGDDPGDEDPGELKYIQIRMDNSLTNVIEIEYYEGMTWNDLLLLNNNHIIAHNYGFIKKEMFSNKIILGNRTLTYIESYSTPGGSHGQRTGNVNINDVISEDLTYRFLQG